MLCFAVEAILKVSARSYGEVGRHRRGRL